MRVWWRIWVSLLALVFVGGVCWVVLAGFKQAMIGPRHEFVLANRPPFLTEELAVDMAREALALDVPNRGDWVVAADGRTTSPDGRRDEFLSRNSINPNQGMVVFRSPDGQSRGVSVELVGDRVICQSALGK